MAEFAPVISKTDPTPTGQEPARPDPNSENPNLRNSAHEAEPSPLASYQVNNPEAFRTLASYGISIDQQKGTITGAGYTVRWDPSKQSLRLITDPELPGSVLIQTLNNNEGTSLVTSYVVNRAYSSRDARSGIVFGTSHWRKPDGTIPIPLEKNLPQTMEQSSRELVLKNRTALEGLPVGSKATIDGIPFIRALDGAIYYQDQHNQGRWSCLGDDSLYQQGLSSLSPMIMVVPRYVAPVRESRPFLQRLKESWEAGMQQLDRLVQQPQKLAWSFELSPPSWDSGPAENPRGGMDLGFTLKFSGPLPTTHSEWRATRRAFVHENPAAKALAWAGKQFESKRPEAQDSSPTAVADATPPTPGTGVLATFAKK